MNLHNQNRCQVEESVPEVFAEKKPRKTLDQENTKVLPILFSLQFIFGLSFSSFFLLPKFLKMKLDCSAAEIGAVMAVGGFSSIVVIPLIAQYIDRVHKRSLIQAGTALTASAAFSFLWVDHVGMLIFVLRGIQGIGFVLVFNGVITTVAEKVPSEKLEVAIGMIGLATLATNAISPAIGEVVAEVDWAYLFILASVMGACAFAISFFVPDSEIRPFSNEQKKTGSQGVVSMRSPGAFALVASLGIGLGFGVIITFYQPFALELGILEVRNFFIGYTGSAILARVSLIPLRTRFSRQTLARWALVLYSLTVFSMSQLSDSLLLWLGIGLGFAHGIAYPVLNAIALSHFPERVKGKVTSYFNGLFNLGYTFGSFGLGFGVSTIGYEGVYCVGAALVAVVVLFQFWALKKTAL